MAHPNEDRFRGGYAAFQTGDMDALRNEYLTADVIWHQPGRNPQSGDYKGIDEVLGSFAKTMELTNGNFSVEIHDCVANDEHGIVLATARGQRPDGRTLEDNYVHVVHFREGKVAESWNHPWDQHKSDEFWA
jgi:uncharacterized protein